MDKLVLIDGNSIAFRAFYALPLLSNSSGFFTNAAYGFTMMLMKVIEEERPTHMLVAFDAGKQTFRHQHYAEYKGKRSKTPPELSEQFPMIKEVLDAFSIAHFELESYEADDIIGTLAAQSNMETVIVTGDKDLFQLIDDRVKVLLMRKGVTEAQLYDIKALREQYNLSPSQMIDLKGLMGDASDNIPGIAGVGEKTALKMLHQFPSVEEILEHIDELPGAKLREKVRDEQEQARLSKQLATICKKVPLTFTVEDLAREAVDVSRVAEVFSRLEFKTLLRRLQEEGSKSREPEKTSFHVVKEEDGQEVASWLDESDEIGIYVEMTKSNPHHAEIVGIGLSDGTKQYYFPDKTFFKWEEICAWIQNPSKKGIFYDVKKAQIMMKQHGVEVANCYLDVHLSTYLLDPSDTQVDLSGVVARHLDTFTLPSDEEVYGKGAKRQMLQGDALAEHVSRKAQALCLLSKTLQAQLEEIDSLSLLRDLEIPLSLVLAQMEEHGILIDVSSLESLGVELREGMAQLTEEIYQLAGTTFNIHSTKQLGVILFDKLGLPVVKKTKTGYSTDVEVLTKLESHHEIVGKILQFRQMGKLLSTYVEGLQKEIGADGKIHTQFHQALTATGRLSSTEPNLQNIPIRHEEAGRIRQAFIPSKKGWLMLSADYSQIDLRVLAHLSEDKDMQRAFREDKDIHTQTAAEVFGVKESDVTSSMRRQAKAVNFGIVYGMSDFGLSQNLNISRKEAHDFIERYFKTYPGVKAYMEKMKEMAKEKGYVVTLFGRRRYLKDIHSSNFHLRGMAERMAMNTPIQGTTADIMKRAMVDICYQMKRQAPNSRMLLQVHDELIFEVPPGELDVMKSLVETEMERAGGLSIPLKVDIHVGQNWYEAK